MIKKLLNNNFNNIINAVKIACPKENLYYQKRLKYYPPGKNTFLGNMNCGIVCYLTSFLLSQNKIEHQVWLSSYGYGEYLEDHVYILINDELIIDPTYKQFFTDYRGTGNCNYDKFLFEDLDPFFIGSTQELDNLKQKIQDHNIKNFGDLEQNIKELSNFWIKQKNVTNKFNLYENWKTKKTDPILKSNYDFLKPLIG